VLQLKELRWRDSRHGDETEWLAGDNGWRSRLMLPDEYRPCQGKVGGGARWKVPQIHPGCKNRIERPDQIGMQTAHLKVERFR